MFFRKKTSNLTPKIDEASLAFHENDFFEGYGAKNPAPDDYNFKLHLSIDLNDYENAYHLLVSFLINAVKHGIIYGFKCMKLTDEPLAKRLETSLHDLELLTYVDQTTKTKRLLAEKRIFNNCFTLYLFNDSSNINEVVKFCQKLQRLLVSNGIKSSSKEFLTEADLLISEHISLRQEKLDNCYVSPVDEPEKVAYLVKGAKESPFYIALVKAFNPIFFELDQAIEAYQLAKKNNDVVTELQTLKLKLEKNYFDNDQNDKTLLKATKYLIKFIAKLTKKDLSSTKLEKTFEKLNKLISAKKKPSFYGQASNLFNSSEDELANNQNNQDINVDALYTTLKRYA